MRILVFPVLCCFLVVSVPAFAETHQQKLQQVQSDLKAQQDKQKALAEKSATLQEKTDAMRSTMLELTQNMQTHEAAVLKLRQARAETEAHIVATEQQLEGQRTALVQVIMARYRLDRVPSQALLLRPSAPIDMARSFDLLQKAIPQVSEQAAEVKLTFAKLHDLHDMQATQEQDLVTEQKALQDKQASLEILLKKREALLAATKAEQEASSRKARALAGQAKDIQDLMDKIAQETALRSQREAAAAAIADQRNKTVNSEESKPVTRTIVKSLSDWFGRVTGKFRLPVMGQVATGYGQSLAGGGHSQGLSISAAPGAIVTAPADGVIRFAGPFRQYKLLVILQHANGEHSLLGGMQELYTRTGAKVVAGEPLGKLPPGGTKLEGDSVATASLYYEKRRNGKAVDPRS